MIPNTSKIVEIYGIEWKAECERFKRKVECEAQYVENFK